ncbi:putative ATP-dependent zinc metalloprotease FTSH 11, chloroplastic/mitochondrial [Cocos nucifera]|nr:putative ATP-dependent zinc metalloprotease FTSH 11, chloroplastic/mitochondrial [Cocos nucifera]
MSALLASLVFRASLSPPIFRPSKCSSVLLPGALRRLDVHGGLFFSPLPKSLSHRRLALVPHALPRENADSAREPFSSGEDSFLDSDSPQGSDLLQETSEGASRGEPEAVLEGGMVGDRQELESGRQVVEKKDTRNRLPLVAFLFGVMASLRRVFDAVMMSEWLSWWPFWRQDKRLERLIAEADANPRDAAKQSALLAELNKHSPESVIRRFEQRNYAVDSKGVAEYLRALVATNTLAEYLPDEQSGKPSSLPTL